MLFPTLSTALLALASLAAAKPVHSTSSTATASAPNASSTSSMTPPTAPGFKWLYTANVLCPPNVMPNVSSPEGVRKGIPIVGGTVDMFDGSQWTIRDLGADWGTVDPRTGIFTADTRYNAYNSKGDDLFFETSGPGQAEGGLHLRVKIETGSEEYYWLNHVVAVGVLKNVGTDAKNVSTLRIDVFNFDNDRNATSVKLLY
ncbi:hypothetical protein DMC30DRAFT_428252 [Rhodotorula diobovata]|uniref:Uncharacterized protein n=1 Tax=Rhodotorula diobovata TaxID=5288 RepID=A0A5C5G3Q6_9BASI|nr:hypothetical protein DMC30DRAFT_428252 [Rhodotorula diobovata]